MSSPPSPQLSISDAEPRDHADIDSRSAYSWEDFSDQDGDQEEIIPPSFNERFDIGEFEEVFHSLRGYLTETRSPEISEDYNDEDERQEEQESDQAEAGAEAEEGTNPPPTKRLRSDELTRVIVISPDGRRHQLDISRESTLMELHQQVRNFLPEGSTSISLSYQVDGTIWRLIPNHETMTVAEFGLEPNCVLRSSYSENSRETDA